MNGRADSLRSDALSRGVERDSREELERQLPDHTGLAFRVAYGVLRQREDAEDVAQEVLVTALQRIGTLRSPERFRAWLVRTCWRRALDHRRSRQRRERREEASPEAAMAPTPEELACGNELRERVLAAIDALPEKLRLVLILCRLQGHDSRRVAAMLGLPDGTVRSRLHAARRRLLEAME